jgi:NADH:ubiquinone reductase (non-electrogenic)
LTWQKSYDVNFKEAKCYKIDAENKKVYCQSNQDRNLDGKEEFALDYDYLVVAMGARANTFNTPGVVEHAHFLKVSSLGVKKLKYTNRIYSFRLCHKC